MIVIVIVVTTATIITTVMTAAIVTAVTAAHDNPAAVMAGWRRSLFQAWQYRLRSTRDADEREESAVDSFRRGTHFEDDVISAHGNVKLRAVFKMTLQDDTLIAQRQHGFDRQRSAAGQPRRYQRAAVETGANITRLRLEPKQWRPIVGCRLK